MTAENQTKPDPPYELHLFSVDSPRRPGNEPFYGEHDWTVDLPLSDGRTLFLHIGKRTHDAFASIFQEEAENHAND